MQGKGEPQTTWRRCGSLYTPKPVVGKTHYDSRERLRPVSASSGKRRRNVVLNEKKKYEQRENQEHPPQTQTQEGNMEDTSTENSIEDIEKSLGTPEHTMDSFRKAVECISFTPTDLREATERRRFGTKTQTPSISSSSLYDDQDSQISTVKGKQEEEKENYSASSTISHTKRPYSSQSLKTSFSSQTNTRFYNSPFLPPPTLYNSRTIADRKMISADPVTLYSNVKKGWDHPNVKYSTGRRPYTGYNAPRWFSQMPYKIY